MKKIAVKLTDIAKDFIKNIQIANPNIAGDISQIDVQQRKNGNIVFDNEIYKQTTLRTYWNQFAKNLMSFINKFTSRLGKNDILYNFLIADNGKVMRELAKDLVKVQKENKQQFFKKGVILGDKYVFELTDQSYTDQLEKEDADDTLEEQKQEQYKLNEKDQKKLQRLKKFVDIRKNKINESIDKILENWDEEKWVLLKQKIETQLQQLENKKNQLNSYFENAKPAQELIDDAILEIQQLVEDVENQNNIDLDVWQNQQKNEEQNTDENVTEEQNSNTQENKADTSDQNADQKKQDNVQEVNVNHFRSDENSVKNDSETNTVEQKKDQEELTASNFVTDDFKKSKTKTQYVESFVKNNQVVISKNQFNKLDNSVSSLVNIVRKNKWKIKVA